MSEVRKTGRGHPRAQPALPLPVRAPRYHRDAFIVAETNAAAWRGVEAWRWSMESTLVICGPAGSGKTHMAHILATAENGVFHDLDAGDAPPGDGLVIFDDMPPNAPHVLFALLEDLGASGRRCVLAGAGNPGAWACGLKDLRTRLEAAPRVRLAEPDEMLIRRVIAKGFRDRQLEVAPAAIEFAAPRLARTFAAAHAFVALADRAALEEKRKISIALVRKIIDTLGQNAPPAEAESASEADDE